MPSENGERNNSERVDSGKKGGPEICTVKTTTELRALRDLADKYLRQEDDPDVAGVMSNACSCLRCAYYLKEKKQNHGNKNQETPLAVAAGGG